jgi:4-diphosphocytidyl-2-C-methyl-D-erythritol kinase
MTLSLSLRAPAKINLYLEIKGNRPDGYHELVMVLQSVGLCDFVHLRTHTNDSVQISCNHPEVPTDRTNLAVKAALLLQQQYPGHGGVDIALDKHIPMGAGLAGGSTNAAAILVGLDRLWDLGLTLSELQELAAQLGSDVPFCISGGTALAVGRGEVLSPLPDLDRMALVICKPRQISISTVWAYQTFRAENLLSSSPIKDRHYSSQMLAAIAANEDANYIRIGRLLYNDLERVVLPAYPQIAELKALLQQDSLGALMSGSGSTVFAIAQDRSHAERLEALVASTYEDVDVWVTDTLVSGIEEI